MKPILLYSKQKIFKKFSDPKQKKKLLCKYVYPSFKTIIFLAVFNEHALDRLLYQ